MYLPAWSEEAILLRSGLQIATKKPRGAVFQVEINRNKLGLYGLLFHCEGLETLGTRKSQLSAGAKCQTRAEPQPATLLDMKETSGNWWDALGWGRWGGRSRARQDGQASVSITPPEWAIRAPRCRPGALMTAAQWGISAEQLTGEGLTAKNAISSNSGRKKI